MVNEQHALGGRLGRPCGAGGIAFLSIGWARNASDCGVWWNWIGCRGNRIDFGVFPNAPTVSSSQPSIGEEAVQRLPTRKMVGNNDENCVKTPEVD